jgi:hypothetical protein
MLTLIVKFSPVDNNADVNEDKRAEGEDRPERSSKVVQNSVAGSFATNVLGKFLSASLQANI